MALYKQKYYCIDCDKKIHYITALYRGKRCKSCARKYQYATRPETNSQYIDGRTNIIKYCIDCGKKLSRCANTANYQRCLSCSRKSNLHWNWLGGNRRGYTIDFSNELKETIRKRDNFKCQICYKTAKKHLQQFNANLFVHHIDYDKENCKETNLISLCNSCHMKTNYRREYWINYFNQVTRRKLKCQNV